MNKSQPAFFSLQVPIERHQLVWPTDASWQQILQRPWCFDVTQILVHWHAQQLPLMVTRQRVEAASGLICLGLPAPTQWCKRKVALQLEVQSLSRTAPCPTLADVAQQRIWRDAAFDLCATLTAQGVQPRVYGSYAWQHLTGLDYIHPNSDLDLYLKVRDVDQAAWVVKQLAQAQLPQRLDGELIFPGGAAVAWREFDQLIKAKVSQVLLKDLRSVRFVSADELNTRCAVGLA